jgi:hypothetical protein
MFPLKALTTTPKPVRETLTDDSKESNSGRDYRLMGRHMTLGKDLDSI